MITQKIGPKTILSTTFVLLLLALGLAWQSTLAQEPTPQMVGPNTPVPVPPYLTGGPSRLSPAAVSSSLSYYFIPGNTFTPGFNTSYFRQVIGCVNQMLRNIPFSAPVHLPQASQVVSITLFTYDSAVTTTVSAAYFIVSDGKGSSGYTVSASSLPNTAGYQQNNSTQNNPATVDNQNYNYLVNWATSGTYDSPILSLCGVRVAYYAPLGSVYLPLIVK